MSAVHVLLWAYWLDTFQLGVPNIIMSIDHSHSLTVSVEAFH